MSYEFHRLEALMEECLQINIVSMRLKSTRSAVELSDKIKAEIQELKNQLARDIIAAPNGLAAEALVQFVQKEVGTYLHDMLQLMDPRRNLGLTPSVLQFYRIVGRELESILSFILRQFTQYIDVDQPVNYSHKIVACQDLNELIVKIRAQYTNAEIDAALVDVIFNSLSDVATSKMDVTYRRMKYAQELADQLRRLADNDNPIESYIQCFDVIAEQLAEVGIPETDLTIKLHLVLLYFNYNSPEYISHCVKAIWNKLRSKERRQKLAILALYGKLMKQLKTKPSYSFLPENPPALQQINDWIEIESNYLVNSKADDSEPATESSQSVEKVEKIIWGISASRLAVLLTVFMSDEIKAITDQNAAKVFRTFAALAITPGSDSLNPAGLRSKANNHRREAVEWSTDFFFKCYNYLRRHHLNK